MLKGVLVAGTVVLLVVVGGWYLMRPKTVSSPTIQTQTQVQESPASAQSAVIASAGAAMNEEKNLVTIGDTGYLPQHITIKAGETVTWVNTDTADHTVSSDLHPTHTIYPALNLGPIKSGTKKTLSFPKAGVYKYHDHLNPSLVGSVTVQ